MDGQVPAEPAKAAPPPRGPFAVPGAARPSAEARRRQMSSRILAAQVCLIIALVAGMQVLNATSGNLIMPSPLDVARQSVIMWSDGTMLRALGQTLLVLGLGFG